MKMEGRKCSHCGSTDVTHDALVRWSNAAQEWLISSTLDNSDCEDCGGETSVQSYELTGKELADAMHERRMCGVDAVLATMRAATFEAGAIGHLVMPELVEQMNAIRSKLAHFAAAMAEHDKLVDALALTLPYAETRAEDLAVVSGTEDKDSPGYAEAASVIGFAEQVLAQHGGKSYLLARGQRAGGAE